MRKKRRRGCLAVVVVLVLVVLAGVGYWAKSRWSGGSTETQTEITPTYGTIEVAISATGTIEPRNRLEIKPPMNGRIEQILVEEGSKVTAGATLAWMSSTERAALLDAARAEGPEALARWEDAYKPTPLIAPIAGEVIVRAVEPGQTVTTADVVLVLSDQLIVNAVVDETDIGKVKREQAARITLDAYPQIKVDGRVEHISYESKVVNNVTMYEVTIVPAAVPEVARSGMSTSVDIVERSKENVLMVPLKALVQEADGTYVLVSEGEGTKPVKRRVRRGIADAEHVEIVSGLDVNDTVIVKGSGYVLPTNSEPKGSPFMRRPRRR